MWLVNIQILLHIIAVVCELMVLVSNRVVLLVVNVAFPCRGVVSVAYQGCTMFVLPATDRLALRSSSCLIYIIILSYLPLTGWLYVLLVVVD